MAPPIPKIAATQGALADMVGSSREAVNRCLRKWQQAGLVTIAEGRIMLADPKTYAEATGL